MGSFLKGCGSCILFTFATWAVYEISLPVFLENLDPEGNIPSDSRLEPKWKRAYGGHHVICHSFHGDIGKQLFQYASLLVLAKPQERILISKEQNSLLENVLIDIKVRPGSSHCQGLEKIKETFCCRDDDRFTKLEPNKNYDFEGSLQTWVYFRHREDLIKKHIQFQKPVLSKAKKVIEHVLNGKNLAKGSNKVLVGIHVERGDLVREKQMIDGYRVAPKEYFQKAMDYYRKQLLGTPIFIVISHDMGWCVNNIAESADVVHIPPQKPEIAMAMFTFVENSIVSVGAFTWWAGYFTKGQVIYYKHPIEPDSKMMTEYGGTMDHTFKPSWKAMY